MNTTIKNTIIFLTGAAVGILGTKIVFDKIYEDRYNKEVESVKNIYKCEFEHINKMNADRVRDLVETIEMTEEEVNTYRTILEKNGYQIYTSEDVKNGNIPELKTKYDTMLESASPKDDDEEDAESEDVLNVLKEASMRPRDVEPYIISYEDYEKKRPDYDKLSVEYYSYDQVLVDEIGSVMDIEDTVGHKAIDKLEHGEEDVIFVRNEWLEIDYEVSLRDMAFDQHLNRD